MQAVAQVRRRGRAALAFVITVKELSDLILPCTFLLRSIKIRVGANLMGVAGGDESIVDGPWLSLVANLQRPSVAMQGIGPALVAFRYFEVR